MKKLIFAAISLTFASSALAAPTIVISNSALNNSAYSLSPKDQFIVGGDDYCDPCGRCCPIWLVDSGGYCMDAPICLREKKPVVE